MNYLSFITEQELEESPVKQCPLPTLPVEQIPELQLLS